MPWVKKASSPDYLNALARLRLAMTGTVDDWLLPWINLVDWGTALDVNAFCEAGPPEPATFTIDDFLPALVGGLPGAGVAIFGLREKVNRRAAEILFADLCENHVATGETCTAFGQYTANLGDGRQFVMSPFWAIPAGCQKMRVKIISWGSGTNDYHLVGYASGSNIANPTPDGNSFGAVNQVYYHTWTAALTHIGAYSNSLGAVMEFSWCLPGTVEDYEPDPIEQPDSAIPPEPGVYTTIADLGAELDAIEQKLHWVLNFTTDQMTDRINPLVADDVIVIEEEDEDVALGPDVMGFIVTLTSIPGSADVSFGEPLQLHNLGRVVMGNGTAWLAPIPLTVTPMLILKPDPTVNVARVHTNPPTGATIVTLIRPKAVG